MDNLNYEGMTDTERKTTEAVHISINYGRLEALRRALDIAEEYERQKPPQYDAEFSRLCLWATLYEAGLMEGKREERQKRK